MPGCKTNGTVYLTDTCLVKHIAAFFVLFLFVARVSAQTVYVTKSGTKYHFHDCKFVQSSGTAMALSEARAKGLTPCGVCKPTAAAIGVGGSNAAVDAETNTVYITKSGSKYHTKSCKYASSATAATLEEAKAKGLTPCGVCQPHD